MLLGWEYNKGIHSPVLSISTTSGYGEHHSVLHRGDKELERYQNVPLQPVRASSAEPTTSDSVPKQMTHSVRQRTETWASSVQRDLEVSTLPGSRTFAPQSAHMSPFRVLRGKVDPLSHTTARVRHDPKAALHDRCYDCHFGHPRSMGGSIEEKRGSACRDVNSRVSCFDYHDTWIVPGSMSSKTVSRGHEAQHSSLVISPS